jgi:hypothetical protein
VTGVTSGALPPLAQIDLSKGLQQQSLGPGGSRGRRRAQVHPWPGVQDLPWDGAAPGVGKRIGCFVGEEERRMGPGRIRGQSAAGGWGSRRSRAGVRGRPVSAGRSLGCRGGLAPRAGGGSRRGHRGRYLALRAAGRAEGRRVLAPGPAPPPRSSSYRSEPSATGALSTKRHFRAAP